MQTGFAIKKSLDIYQVYPIRFVLQGKTLSLGKN